MNKLIGLVALAFFATATLVTANAQDPSGGFGFQGNTYGFNSGSNPYFSPATAQSYHVENYGGTNTKWTGVIPQSSTHYHAVKPCGPCGPTVWQPHTVTVYKQQTHTTSYKWRNFSGFDNGYQIKTYNGWDNGFYQETVTDR